MVHSKRRRSLLLAMVALPFSIKSFAVRRDTPLSKIQTALAKLETDSGVRLGLSFINSFNNTQVHYRSDERFPLCGTYKVVLVAAVFKRSMKDDGLLQQRLHYHQNDLVSYSPITEKYTDQGMTIYELCVAAIQYSDNGAANLLLKVIGGPTALTAFTRAIGDKSFRLDRREPELNSAVPHDLQDTTTPMAMANTLKAITLGNVLSKPLRERFQQLLIGNTTGMKSIRAGIPFGWTVGDKTGSGAYGTTNDIAVIWPSNKAPLILTVYVTHNDEQAPARQDIIASATRIIINSLNKS
jgi:beta-lactamase class A